MFSTSLQQGLIHIKPETVKVGMFLCASCSSLTCQTCTPEREHRQMQLKLWCKGFQYKTNEKLKPLSMRSFASVILNWGINIKPGVQSGLLFQRQTRLKASGRFKLSLTDVFVLGHSRISVNAKLRLWPSNLDPACPLKCFNVLFGASHGEV